MTRIIKKKIMITLNKAKGVIINKLTKIYKKRVNFKKSLTKK